MKIIGKTMIINSMVTERSSYFCELKKYSRCVFLFPIPKSAELTRTIALTWCAWWREKGISDESYRLVATSLASLKSTLEKTRGFQLRRNHARVSSPRFSLPLPHAPLFSTYFLRYFASITRIRCRCSCSAVVGRWSS